MYFYIYHQNPIILLTLTIHSFIMALMTQIRGWSNLDIIVNGAIVGPGTWAGFPPT